MMNRTLVGIRPASGSEMLGAGGVSRLNLSVVDAPAAPVVTPGHSLGTFTGSGYGGGGAVVDAPSVAIVPMTRAYSTAPGGGIAGAPAPESDAVRTAKALAPYAVAGALVGAIVAHQTKKNAPVGALAGAVVAAGGGYAYLRMHAYSK